MKQKIIRSFLAVYLVLSMVYGGIRAAYIVIKAAVSTPEITEETVALPASFGIDAIPVTPEQDATTMPPPVIQTEDDPENSAAEQRSEEILTPSPEEVADPGAFEVSSPEPDAAESVWEEPAEEASVSEEMTEAYEDMEDEASYIEEAPSEDVPSLDEYLSTLHCGRCGRNCYLSNPRCRTGRNKAESETSVYYELYGVSDEI